MEIDVGQDIEMRPDYQSVILRMVPDRCERALDVGCGHGALTRRLRTLASGVEGIDKDRRSIEKARAHPDAGDIAYHYGDFLTWPFAAESFDLITAVASVHHMDAEVALQRMRRLLRPGGCLALVGLARGDSPVDWAISVPAAIGATLHRFAAFAGRTCAAPDEYSAPVCWPPPASYRDMRHLAQQWRPKARYRRHLYWRYSLTWSKPL